MNQSRSQRASTLTTSDGRPQRSSERGDNLANLRHECTEIRVVRVECIRVAVNQ